MSSTFPCAICNISALSYILCKIPSLCSSISELSIVCITWNYPKSNWTPWWKISEYPLWLAYINSLSIDSLHSDSMTFQAINALISRPTIGDPLKITISWYGGNSIIIINITLAIKLCKFADKHYAASVTCVRYNLSIALPKVHDDVMT